jgi:hypothetical protein
MRVWPEHATAPATVVEVSGSDVEVASVTPSVIATRWVPYASLSPIAIAATAIWPAPGSNPDAHARIHAGHRLDRPSNGWAAVHEPEGFVPESFAGMQWTEPEPPPEKPFAEMTVAELRQRPIVRALTGDVRVAADDTAAIRVAMTAPTMVQILSAAPNDYLAVTVHLPFAEVDGFWKRPPPPPMTTSDEAEAEIDIGPPPIHSPIAVGTCLYDAPHGNVVGLIRGEEAYAVPVPAKTAGWYVATIPTIWGPSTYYIDAAPIPPPPQPEPATWQWGNEW